MAKMTEEEKAARKAEREAKQKAELEAYAKEVAAGFPPLTREQADVIATLLFPSAGRWPRS